MHYGIVFLFFIFALLFVAAGLIVNRLIMPYNPTDEKNMIYECGLDPEGEAHIRYSMRFYVFALMYVIFAVEAAFLIPWAVVYRSISGFFPLVEAVIFVFILILGLAYAWKRGDLKWV